jgi:hypothetical protein
VEKSVMPFSKFRETYRCTLAQAIDIVKQRSGKKHVFVGVDEFARVFAEDSQNLKLMMSDVGRILDDIFTGTRVNFLFSSLATVPLKELGSASERSFQVMKFWFLQQCLHSNLFKEYNLKQLESVEKLFDGSDLLDADGTGQELVKMAGGHPRTLEVIHTLLTEEKQKKLPAKLSFSELLHQVMQAMGKSNITWKDAKSLVGSAICRIPVSETQRILTHVHSDEETGLTVDEARRNGYCSYLVKAYTAKKFVGFVPVLTPIQLLHYFKEANARMGLIFQDAIHSSTNQADFGGRPFEYFHSLFDAYSRMSWRTDALSRPHSVLIRDFYKRNFDATVGGNIRNDDIPLYDNYVYYKTPDNFLDFFVPSDEFNG